MRGPAVLLLLAAACGTPGGGTPDGGTVGGYPLEVKDGLFFKLNVAGIDRLVVAAVDRTGACAREQAAKDKANSTVLVLKFITEGGQIPPGYYPARAPPLPGETPPSAWVEGIFQRFGPLHGTQCDLVQEQAALGGIVELKEAEAAAGKKARGKFDLVFSSEDRLTGEFEVPFCDISQAPEQVTCEP